MRAVVRVGHEAADMESTERSDALLIGGGDPPPEPPAHAVAGDRDRAAADLLEPVEVGAAVADDPLGRQLADQRHDAFEDAPALLGIGKAVEVDHRRAAGPVEDVGREHHVALSRDPIGHPLDLRAQAERIDCE